MKKKTGKDILMRILMSAVLMLAPSLAHAYLGFYYSVKTDCPHWEDGVLQPTMDEEWMIECYENETFSLEGKTYMKVYCTPASHPTTARSTNMSEGDNGQRNYTLGIRVADGKVYVNCAEYMDHLSKTGFSDLVYGFLGNPDYVPYHLTDAGEMILYDYTMNVGDQYLHVDGYEDISVVEKDMVTLNDGKERRRLILNNGLVLIEVLGCINSTGLLLDYLNPAENSGWLGATLVLACTENGEFYKDDSYTPPVNGVTIVNGSLNLTSRLLYDLQGRLTGKPSHGIYIRDGRKHVVK